MEETKVAAIHEQDMTPEKPEIDEANEDNSEDDLVVSPEPVSVGNMVDSRSNIRLHLHR